MYLNSDYFVNNSNACVLGDEINVLLTYLFFLSLVIFAMIFYCAYEYEIFGKKENCIWDLLTAVMLSGQFRSNIWIDLL